jgi:hypothetical protein
MLCPTPPLYWKDTEVCRPNQSCPALQHLSSQYWSTSQNAADTPWNDLLFVKNLSGYFQIDKEVATACLIGFKRHLDNLTPEMTFLSLASKKVPIEEKKDIAKTIDAQPQVELSIQPARPIRDSTLNQIHRFTASRVCC